MLRGGAWHRIVSLYTNAFKISMPIFTYFTNGLPIYLEIS